VQIPKTIYWQESMHSFWKGGPEVAFSKGVLRSSEYSETLYQETVETLAKVKQLERVC
jgi:hypothetical protein